MIRRTPAQLVQAIRSRYQLPPLSMDSLFPTPDDIKTFLNEALQVCQHLVQTAGGALETSLEVRQNVSAGTAFFALPTGFVSLVEGPFISDDGGETWVELKPATRDWLVRRSEELETPDTYQLTNGNLLLAPLPNKAVIVAFKARVTAPFIPAGDAEWYLDEATQFSGPYGWDAYVAAHVTLEIAIADRKDPSWYQNRLKEARATLAQSRLMSNEAKIEQVEDVWADEPAGLPVDTVGQYEWLRSGSWRRRV